VSLTDPFQVDLCICKPVKLSHRATGPLLPDVKHSGASTILKREGILPQNTQS
jgi:hypothetical protein